MGKTPEELLRELETAGVLGGRPSPGETVPQRSAPRAQLDRQGPILYLLIGALVVAALGSTPIGQVALYPFSLFVTLVHEACHAVAAIVTGGTVVNLRVSSDLSGLTITAGGLAPVVASAGYVGAAVVGALVIAMPRRASRLSLVGLTLVPAATLVFFHPATLFTAVWCGAFATLLLLGVWFLSPSWLIPIQMFLGLEIGLNAIRDLITALVITGTSSHIRTDADLMSSALFLRPLVWVTVWTALSGAVLIAAVWRVLSRGFYSP
jgi:Peptidase M50B-like